MFEKDDLLTLFEGKFNGGAQGFGVGGAEQDPVGIFDKERRECGRLAATLLDVGGKNE
jgi:hypothetical protein